jgi:hypothetical protein
MFDAICLRNSPEHLSPTIIIFILAKYKDIPLAAKTKIMAIGISHANVVSLSINIFFTAGSNNQAVPDVLAATTIESNN